MRRSNQIQMTAACGIGAVVTYITATVLGGRLRPRYSHVADDISKLVEAGAPHRYFLAAMYSAYNVLLALFGIGLWRTSPRSRLFAVGSSLVALNCVSGVLQATALRRDPDGVTPTLAGKGHLVAAGISALCTVLSAFVFGFAFRRDRFWRPLRKVSLAISGAIPVFGALTTISVTRGSKFMGLLERVTIGLSLLWAFTLSVFALVHAQTEAGIGRD